MKLGLLLKRDFERVTFEDGIVQYEVFYRDYRDVDGLKLPSTIEQRSPDSTMIPKFSEIKNNAAIEDAAFRETCKIRGHSTSDGFTGFLSPAAAHRM